MQSSSHGAKSSKWFETAAKALATAGGAGYSPIAPGTCGTLVAVPLVWLTQSWSMLAYLALTAAIIVLGSWAAEVSDRAWGTHDSGRIVIDEVAGYFVTMAVAPRESWTMLAAAFAAFRFFDIVKPPPIRQIDQGVGGGLGVVLDDVGAGFYAAVVMLLLQYFSPTF